MIILTELRRDKLADLRMNWLWKDDYQQLNKMFRYREDHQENIE